MWCCKSLSRIPFSRGICLPLGEPRVQGKDDAAEQPVLPELRGRERREDGGDADARAHGLRPREDRTRCRRRNGIDNQFPPVRDRTGDRERGAALDDVARRLDVREELHEGFAPALEFWPRSRRTGQEGEGQAGRQYDEHRHEPWPHGLLSSPLFTPLPPI